MGYAIHVFSLELTEEQTEEQISSKDTFSENNPNITLASHEETFISDVELDENLNENVLEKRLLSV